MPIFNIKKITAHQLTLQKDGFGNEAALRDFFASNLDRLLGVRFLANEYPTNDGGRIDTIGLDENNSPVIIEYKWKENEEVLTQGLSYYNWLVNNKRHFELLVDKILGTKTKVNWDQPRVLLVAQEFSKRIRGAVPQVAMVELKTYSLYEGDILHIENEYSPVADRPGRAKRSDIVLPIAQHDLDYHLTKTSPAVRALISRLREKILQLADVEEKTGQKAGITYRTTKSFARFEFRPSWVQLLLRDPHYPEDTQGLVTDITSNEWGYNGKVKVTADSDLDYIFSLVHASYSSTL